MNSWLRSSGAWEMVPCPADDVMECAPDEIRLITASSGSCEAVFDDGSVSIAGDKVLMLRGCAPVRLERSPDFHFSQIVIRPGKSRPGVMSPADMYAAYPDYRSFCAMDARYLTFHDKFAQVLSAQALIATYQKYDATERDLLTGCELCALLLCAASACAHSCEAAPLANKHVRAAIRFMRDNYMFDITTEDIATAAGVHVGHLHRLFTEQTGTHPGQYLINLRIEKAKFLLARTDLSMLNISRLCGITTQQYFSRCFKRTVGITPQEYRRTYALTCDYGAVMTHYETTPYTRG